MSLLSRLTRSSRPGPRRTASHVEPLEQRRLLTTLYGGEVLEFLGSDNVPYRIVASGDISVEIIAAAFFEGGPALFPLSSFLTAEGNNFHPSRGDVSDLLRVDPDTGQVGLAFNGGFGALDGADPLIDLARRIGVDPLPGNSITVIDDALTLVGDPPAPLGTIVGPSTDISVTGLAANQRGATYGFNVIADLERTDIDPGTGDPIDVNFTAVQLISFSNVSGRGTVVDALHEDILALMIGAAPGFEADDIVSVVAADFNPLDDNELYFVANLNVGLPDPDGGTEPQETEVPVLFVYDTSSGVLRFATGDLGSGPVGRSDFGSRTPDTTPEVFAMSFDSAGQLWVYGTARAVTGQGSGTAVVERTGLFLLITPGAETVLNSGNALATPDLGGDPTAIELSPESDQFIYASTGNGDLFRIDTLDVFIDPVLGASVSAIRIGTTIDNEDTGSAQRGASVVSLTWNPALLNIFKLSDDTNSNDRERGVLMAFDDAADEIIFIDTTVKVGASDIFTLTVTGTDPNAFISFAPMADRDDEELPNPMNPYTGGASVRVIDATGAGDPFTITTQGGSAYVGLRDEDDNPILEIPLDTFQGQVPRVKLNTRRADDGTQFVRAGMRVEGTIGRSLISGAVSGQVYINGSIDLFYAGAVLTGNAGGLPANAISDISDNFFVRDDMRSLLTLTPLGSNALAPSDDATYNHGFDLEVGGRMGVIRAPSFYGMSTVNNSPAAVPLGTAMSELEVRLTDDDDIPGAFQNGSVATTAAGIAALTYNDTLTTAQMLSTPVIAAIGRGESVSIFGSLQDNLTTNNDPIDVYSLPLLAGQTVTVQLVDLSPFATPGFQFIRLGIFDPDGRLIHTDFSHTGLRAGLPIRFTADRPGLYRFAVTVPTDGEFAGSTALDPEVPYQILATGIADIAFGGLHLDGGAFVPSAAFNGQRVRFGDLGAIYAPASAFRSTGVPLPEAQVATVLAERGNVRVIEAGSIGISDGVASGDGVGPALSDSISVLAPRGSVGLIRNLGTAGTDTLLLNLGFPIDGAANIAAASVGVDYQMISATNTFLGFVYADRGIGVIRAADVGTLETSGFYAVNADNRGNDGFIDLIDVTGDFGTLSAGGPAITTGNLGNVRYLRVGGLLFRDRFFGGGGAQVTNFAPGVTARLVDDSGTAYAVNMEPRTPVAFPGTGFDNPGAVSVLLYGVRDKAGAIPVRIQGQPGPGLTNRGLRIDADDRGAGASVDIGELTLFHSGTPITFDTFTRQFTQETQGEDPANNEILLRGARPINVFQTNVFAPGTTTPTGISSIRNATPGEMLNVNAAALLLLEGENVGIPRPLGRGDLVGALAFAATYPFVAQPYLITVTELAEVRARGAVGNISAGNIGTITANSDGVNTSGRFEGIAAPVFSTLSIGTVNIGEGVLPSGSGNVSFAGLYVSGGSIARIRGRDADIRGDIGAGSSSTIVNPDPTQPPLTIGGIGAIELNNGSIINAEVGVVGDLLDLRDNDVLTTVPQFPDDVNNPVFEIGNIDLSNGGGIIGASIIGGDIARIRTSGGFGIINSRIGMLGEDRMLGLDVDGYGIRSVLIDGGAQIDSIVARGDGQRLNTRSFSAGVRLSERVKFDRFWQMGFDPYFGTPVTTSTDLHTFLGTSSRFPRRRGFSEAGNIEDSVFTGNLRLGKVEAFRFVGRGDGLLIPAPFTPPAFSGGPLFDPAFNDFRSSMQINFATGVGQVIARDYAEGLVIVAGGVDLLQSNRDVLSTALSISGRIKDVRVNAGGLTDNVYLFASGPEGTIGNVVTSGAVNARIRSELDLTFLGVGTDLGSPFITVGRNVGLLQVNGSIVSGADVLVENTINRFILGGNLDAGAIVRAASINEQQIGGAIFGDLIIG